VNLQLSQSRPALGLVCVTVSDAVRYRTLTRTNYLKLPLAARAAKLRDLYTANLETMLRALEFCRAHDLRLYRVTSQLFPMSDLEDGVGAAVVEELSARLLEVGARAAAFDVRVVVHPEQFVVLSSDTSSVARNAVSILEGHARQLDLMGLPASQWTMLLIHGGKGGRGEVLAKRIAALPDNVRSRLALENDEHAYGAADILAVCREAGVPMVFDAHHHAVHAKLESYEDESVTRFTTAARATWSDPAWQIVHLSNGKDGFLDRRHSDLIDTFPSAFLNVPFVELEAKAKEIAIADLRPRLERDEPVLHITRDPPSDAAFPDAE
jgi:UV DNA damage endonuclease